MSDVWNNVTIFGPTAEIERFKRESIDAEENVCRVSQFGWEGCDCVIRVPAKAGGVDVGSKDEGCFWYVWNFQQFYSNSSCEYSFSFDTQCAFPDKLFDRLAEAYPSLAFDCKCIECLDEFLGYGWFNPPEGGEEFSQDFEVPENYWSDGLGVPRNPVAQTAHEARISSLTRMLCAAPT